MREIKPKTCYDCQHFSLCRLRDKATDLTSNFNMSGNFMGSKFRPDLLTLMGSSCSEFRKVEEESDKLA